jgi:hypothetical protein
MYDTVLIIGSILLVVVSQYFIEKMGIAHYETKGRKELYDIAHEIFPDISNYEPIINIIPVGLLASLFFISNGGLIAKNGSLMFLLSMFLRAILASSTILPKAPHCKSEITLTSIFGGCYDKIYSGHMSLTTILGLTMVKEHAISVGLFFALVAITAITLLLVRAHYTVDVLLGFLVSYFIVDGYYDYINAWVKKVTS